MENNSNFSIQRIGWLIRNDIWEGYKLIAVFALAIFGFFLIPYLGNDIDQGGSPMIHEILYPMLLLVGGFIFTSVIFRELYTKPRGQFYLTLPASHLEKITSKWLLSAILYPIGITIGYWLFSVIANGIHLSIWDKAHPSFFSYLDQPFSKLLPSVYLIMQVVFFVGAVTFTKYNIFKTGFSLFIGWIVIALILALLFRLIMWNYFDGLQFPNQAMRGLEPSASLINLGIRVEKIGEYLLLYAFAPYLLLVSYFKLKEREI